MGSGKNSLKTFVVSVPLTGGFGFCHDSVGVVYSLSQVNPIQRSGPDLSF